MLMLTSKQEREHSERKLLCRPVLYFFGQALVLARTGKFLANKPYSITHFLYPIDILTLRPHLVLI